MSATLRIEEKGGSNIIDLTFIGRGETAQIEIVHSVAAASDSDSVPTSPVTITFPASMLNDVVAGLQTFQG